MIRTVSLCGTNVLNQNGCAKMSVATALCLLDRMKIWQEKEKTTFWHTFRYLYGVVLEKA